MTERFDRERTNVGPGWQPILDRAREELLAVAPGFDAVQIKEKFGELRLYVMTGDGFNPDNTDKFWATARAAERESARTCEECGRTGEGITNESLGPQSYWLRTLCVECRANLYETWQERNV